MPDVSRSDSQRSDTSLRPRVSFNRDVHVKRIVPREGTRLVGALSTDGDGHLINATVRKERIRKTRKELAEEAAQVLEQVDQLNCTTHDPTRNTSNITNNERYFSLPTRKKPKRSSNPTASLDRKPPRTHPTTNGITTSEPKKKQLSPIIENTQREDYFSVAPTIKNGHHEPTVTQQLKKYIDEVDRQLDEDNRRKKTNLIVIDIDNAEKIADSSHLSKLRKKLKSIRGRPIPAPPPLPTLVQARTASLQRPERPRMIHSSQRPPDKPPLTRGRTVDRMIRRLNRDAPHSPPPRPQATVVAPTAHLQHNRNQPFSYTRGLSPEKSATAEPIIYAQVVCPTNGLSKQTVHTFYTKHHQQHSDSDEGLGIDERKPHVTHFGDQESPITPKYRVLSFECLDERGRADGMDARRRESFEEEEEHKRCDDVSARRDLLESRLTKRISTNHYKSNPDMAAKRADSGEFGRVRKNYYNESEDEGFASSLLIATEPKQPLGRYDSGEESGEYKARNLNYSGRERCIDDGSHFDPRLDKEFRTTTTTTTSRRNEKKPPKVGEKRSGLEKVKRLFSRDGKKSKKPVVEMVQEGSLRARYTEYKGSREHLEPGKRSDPESDHFTANHTEHRYESRRRLSTPSPSSSPTRDSEPKRPIHTSWFKSLDRLARKKNKNEESSPKAVPPKPKSLRFFGDTDQDSSDGSRPRPIITKNRSQSSRDLHNITEEPPHHHHHQKLAKRTAHKSLTSLKPPVSPHRQPATPEAAKSRRKRHEISSVESSTEGDSSQQSQRSVVYLHAATVGDIPGPVHLKQAKRAQSRDELHEPGRIQPQIKTLSRSFSVLAPWKPRHAHDYAHHQKMKDTLQRKAADSKENLAKSSTLYKKKAGRLPRENSRYSRGGEEKKAKSASVESLRGRGDLGRSLSMPKDPEKSAGWFKLNKKSQHHRSDYITQRL